MTTSVLIRWYVSIIFFLASLLERPAVEKVGFPFFFMRAVSVSLTWVLQVAASKKRRVFRVEGQCPEPSQRLGAAAENPERRLANEQQTRCYDLCCASLIYASLNLDDCRLLNLSSVGSWKAIRKSNMIGEAATATTTAPTFICRVIRERPCRAAPALAVPT